MIRWLWPVTAAYLFMVSFSAMRFDRINHAKVDKDKWSVLGIEIPLSATSDFFVWALPLVAGGLLAASMILWLYARHHANADRGYRIPPIFAAAKPSSQEVGLDKALRIAYAFGTVGLGTYATVHLCRHLLMHSVFDHSTKGVFHGPGLIRHLTRWSSSGDLRFGQPEGMTYYAGFQSSFYLVMAVFALAFTSLWLWRLARR